MDYAHRIGHTGGVRRDETPAHGGARQLSRPSGTRWAFWLPWATAASPSSAGRRTTTLPASCALKGYRAALEGIGHRADRILCGARRASPSNPAFECMKRIYEENRDLPTAVMVSSDLMAIGAMQCACSLGVFGAGGDERDGLRRFGTRHVRCPRASTVRVSYQDEGVAAAEDLLPDALKAEPAARLAPHPPQGDPARQREPNRRAPGPGLMQCLPPASTPNSTWPHGKTV